jgi:hypothetical protein
VIAIDDTTSARHYVDPLGARWPSVSTVLAATAGKRWGLERWRRNLGEETAEQVGEIARHRGTVLHRQILAYMRTGVVPAEPTVWWKSLWPLVRGLRAMGEVVLAEQPLIHELEGYGGTPDLVLRVAGRLLIIDYKTSDAIRPPALLRDYADQVAGYADLVAWHLGERPELAQVVVAVPGVEGGQQHTVDLAEALPRWRDRLAAYRLHTAP